MSVQPQKSDPTGKSQTRRTRDEKGSVDIGDSISVVGSLNTGVVISPGNITAVNVGGSAVQGDIYQTRGAHIPDDIGEAIKNLKQATPEQKAQLEQALQLLNQELGKGPNCDTSMVNLIVTDMQTNSPEIARLTAQWITDQPEISASAKAIARRLTA
jgi:hypothetical protein